MKNFIFLISVVFAQLVFAQSPQVSESYDKIGKYVNGVAFVHKNGLVGFIDLNGKEIVKPEYDKIGYFGSDKLAFTHKDGLVGIIHISGKVILKPTYERISGFRYGRAIVRKNNLCGVIDSDGNLLIEPLYIKINQSGYDSYTATSYDGAEVVIKPKK